MKNAEWKLMDLTRTRTSTVYTCCPDAYVNLNFKMTLKRNSALYCSILLMPAAGMCMECDKHTAENSTEVEFCEEMSKRLKRDLSRFEFSRRILRSFYVYFYIRICTI